MREQKYTPFMTSAANKIAQGLTMRNQQRQQQAEGNLMGNAMMGDTQSLQNLYMYNPQLAAQVQQRNEQLATASQQAAMKKKIDFQNQYDKALEFSFSAPDYDTAKGAFIEKLSPWADIYDVERITEERFTPDVYEAGKSSLSAGKGASYQWGASYVQKDDDNNKTYLVSQKRNPTTGETSLSKTEITGKLADNLGLSAEEKAELTVTTAGDRVTAETQAKIDAETARDNVERVAAAQSRIASLVEGGKLKARDAALLSSTQVNRVANTEKAKYFLDAFKSGDFKSGVGRKVSNYLPIGVWTDQGEFDELLDSFAEVAAREKLKASGETRPTDADVSGMKKAMFGIGRDEQVNIKLLEEFIAEQQSLEQRLADFESESMPTNLGDSSEMSDLDKRAAALDI